MTTPPPPGTPVTSDADLLEVWQGLMGPEGFDRRSLWVLFLDEDGRLLPAVMPIDDVPVPPDTAMLASLARVVDGALDGPGTAATLLARPGVGRMLGSDRAWARAVKDALGSRSPWPVHLATVAGVVPFAGDDLLAAS